MPRADELSHGDRIRLPPHIGTEIVVVDHVTNFLTKTRVHFKTKGHYGNFVVSPQYELEDCT
jgi:formylmethanofuran dehydrogenase subunit D